MIITVREADRAEAHAWSVRMEGSGGGGEPYSLAKIHRKNVDDIGAEMSSLR
jgi:hypothetical protein